MTPPLYPAPTPFLDALAAGAVIALLALLFCVLDGWRGWK